MLRLGDEHFGHAQYAVQRGAYLVADIGDEVGLGATGRQSFGARRLCAAIEAGQPQGVAVALAQSAVRRQGRQEEGHHKGLQGFLSRHQARPSDRDQRSKTMGGEGRGDHRNGQGVQQHQRRAGPEGGQDQHRETEQKG